MSKHLTARYGLIHGTYWMVYASISGYISLYLLEQGFSNGAIGAAIALAGVVSALLQPVVAGYADKENSRSLKSINLFVAGLTGLCGLGLCLIRKDKEWSMLLYALALALLQLQTPLVNGLGVTSINCGEKLNYGVSKSLSSVTFALVSFLLGRLTAARGGEPVPVAITLCSLLFIGSICLYPTQRAPRQPGQGAGVQGLAFFKKYPRFTGVLLGCILIYISHALLNNFTLQIMVTKGGNSSHMGLAMALAALSELPTMLLFTKMLQKKNSGFWMKLTGFFFLLKALGSWLAPNVAVYCLLQLTQVLAWALIRGFGVLHQRRHGPGGCGERPGLLHHDLHPGLRPGLPHRRTHDRPLRCPPYAHIRHRLRRPGYRHRPVFRPGDGGQGRGGELTVYS